MFSFTNIAPAIPEPGTYALMFARPGRHGLHRRAAASSTDRPGPARTALDWGIPVLRRSARWPTRSSSPSTATIEAHAAARAGQPPRPDHRRHRHRQDGHAADARRELQPHRRAGLHGRREGRPDRHHARPARSAPKLAARAEGARPRPRPRRSPARSRSGTCSASRATRCARPSPTWARCCSARMLGLNETQAGVLNLVFKIADDNGLLLLDLKDLRAMLQYVGDNAQPVHHRVRQRQRGQRRRDPARPAADRGAGRRQVLRRADARHRRLHADRSTATAWSTSSPPTSC